MKVYTASKLSKAALWRQLRVDQSGIEFTARWPSYSGREPTDPEFVPDTPENAKWFWLEDEEDVAKADVVLVFAEGDEHLRGALVEAGMGIALKKRVIVIGEHKDYGTWQFHPRVERVATLDEAWRLLTIDHGLRP
jgi:nucleoside 2-deoxyribosyltransferase